MSVSPYLLAFFLDTELFLGYKFAGANLLLLETTPIHVHKTLLYTKVCYTGGYGSARCLRKNKQG